MMNELTDRLSQLQKYLLRLSENLDNCFPWQLIIVILSRHGKSLQESKQIFTTIKHLTGTILRTLPLWRGMWSFRQGRTRMTWRLTWHSSSCTSSTLAPTRAQWHARFSWRHSPTSRTLTLFSASVSLVRTRWGTWRSCITDALWSFALMLWWCF